MKQEESDSPQIIQFVLPSRPSVCNSSSRDELAQMVRKVLSPQELFKMNAPKRKKSSSVEIISFEAPAQEIQNG